MARTVPDDRIEGERTPYVLGGGIARASGASLVSFCPTRVPTGRQSVTLPVPAVRPHRPGGR